MGLFEDIGRKVGEISHEAKEATREQASYKCADCGNLVYSDRDTCPECGSENLDPHESADDGAERSETTEDANGESEIETDEGDATGADDASDPGTDAGDSSERTDDTDEADDAGEPS